MAGVITTVFSPAVGSIPPQAVSKMHTPVIIMRSLINLDICILLKKFYITKTLNAIERSQNMKI
jgi:hypothetical protein